MLTLPRPLGELRLESLAIDMAVAALSAGSLAEATTLRTLVLLPPQGAGSSFSGADARTLLALAGSLPRLRRVEFAQPKGKGRWSWPHWAAIWLMDRLAQQGLEVEGDAIGAYEWGDTDVDDDRYQEV